MARQKKVSNDKGKSSKKAKLMSYKKKTSKSKSRSSNTIESEDECGSSSTYRQLLKFKKVEELLYLASRIFQKEPQVSHYNSKLLFYSKIMEKNLPPFLLLSYYPYII